MAIKTDYAPGRCNIGTAEIRRRRLSGWVGLGLFVAVVAALLLMKASPACWPSISRPGASFTTTSSPGTSRQWGPFSRICR